MASATISPPTAAGAGLDPAQAAAASQAIAAATEALAGSMDLLLVTTMLTGTLIPITVTLFATRSQMWKAPVFILNAVTIFLGFALGSLTIYYIKHVLAGVLVSSYIILAVNVLYFFIPFFVQCILMIRVSAVYPPRSLGWIKFLLIYGTAATIMLARLANAIVEWVKLAEAIHNDDGNLLLLVEVAWRMPYTKVEWFLQLFFDTFASSLFLVPLRNSGIFRRTNGSIVDVFTNSNSYASRLRALFWIAVFNFVFPVILNIVLLVFYYQDSDPLHGIDVIMVTVTVEIYCVLLATIWCTRTYWDTGSLMGKRSGDRQVQLENGGTTESMDSAKFAPPSTLGSYIHPVDEAVTKPGK